MSFSFTRFRFPDQLLQAKGFTLAEEHDRSEALGCPNKQEFDRSVNLMATGGFTEYSVFQQAEVS
jgi:hypothetical protein